MSVSYTLVPYFMTLDDNTVDVVCDSEHQTSIYGHNLVRKEFHHTHCYMTERLRDLAERDTPLPVGDEDQLVQLFRVMLQLQRAMFKSNEQS